MAFFAPVSGKRRKQQFLRPAWKDHFTFSMRERRGVFVLVLLLSLQISILYYLRIIKRPERPKDWQLLLQKSDSLLSVLNMDTGQTFRVNEPYHNTSTVRQASITPFDPNTLDVVGWRSIGLSQRQAQAIVNYHHHGGVFKVKKDLYRIKVVGKEVIASWMSHVKLPDSVAASQPYPRVRELRHLDIALADSGALEKLRGVGPVLAGRIVKYRQRLGGFIAKEQLREVYGLNDTLWSVIEPQIMFSNTAPIVKLSINSTPLDSLKVHPYIGYRLAAQIVAYRRQHSFTGVEELKRLPLVSEEIYRKFAPYLDAR